MQVLKMRLHEMKPALILVYLSLMGFLSIFSVQLYLDIPFDLPGCLTYMGIIFGIYTLNRYTDTTEDFTNDIGKHLFFQRQKAFLILAGASLAVSIGFLVFTQRLNWMHFLLLAMGFGYSYRLVPWYSRSSGFELLRIKEMTGIKNLAVSVLWSASVFVVPILYSSSPFDAFTIWLLAAGLFISTLNNTLFDDILDEPGDRVAGIRTVPTAWGGFKSQIMLMGVDVVWLATVSAIWISGGIDGAHALFLAFLGLYPFLYMGLNLAGKGSKGLIDFLSESDLLFFALGMLLLSVFR